MIVVSPSIEADMTSKEIERPNRKGAVSTSRTGVQTLDKIVLLPHCSSALPSPPRTGTSVAFICQTVIPSNGTPEKKPLAAPLLSVSVLLNGSG